MDQQLLAILACPICKSTLYYEPAAQELICKIDHLAFPIREEIPVMLESEARKLDETSNTSR